MSRSAIVSTIALAALSVANQAWSADCQSDLRAKLEPALRTEAINEDLLVQLRGLMAKPRDFEDPQQGANCSRPTLDNPLYPGIPVKECSYQRLGLSGWVTLANPSAEVAAKWITAACSGATDVKACSVQLTAKAWCASQFTFPVVGNLIQPDPLNPQQGVNTAFLHGVEIARPAWLTQKTPLPAATQKQRFSPLLASANAYSGPVGAVSWPSGLSASVYAQEDRARPPAAKAALAGACPAIARRDGWLAISQAAYNQAWRNARNPLFDLAAKALSAQTSGNTQRCP
ncbi:hypothetical protein OVA11_19475 [Caulobacter sp. SL161]|uniref:hypothetical protein n=1 Tax=Caulobacter sp. SL161 TaxID=2995156 RepID=UPI0022739CD8|nr:hypothetical protein [Caulobacter sp. SL161]MCY1649159.1 hypothetical protein [Caulobacter sp. SL161]